MADPVLMMLGPSDLLPLMSSVSWLEGYVSASREIPEHVRLTIDKLAEWCATVTPRLGA